MRLLVISQYFWPENFRINDLVADLVERGHDVTVLTGVPNYPDGEVFQQFRNDPQIFDQYKGSTIIRVPMVPRGQNSFCLLLNYLSFAISASVLGAWRLRGKKFDSIFAYEPSPVTVGLPAVVMRKLKNAPLVFWVLDLWPDTLQALGIVRSTFSLNLVGKLVSFIYQRCELILAQSRSFIPQIQKYCLEHTKVLYFPSWAEPALTSDGFVPLFHIAIPSGSFNVMFAGNVGEAQDFPAILAAADILKHYTHIRWLIVGDGRMAHWVANEIQRRELSNNLFMLGRYPPEYMPAIFKYADVLLVSLKSEPIFAMTIPGKLQSYLAAGKPVLAMLDGEGAQLVDRNQAGLTCPAGDAAGLASAVLALSELPLAEREKMGRNGLLVSSRDFDRKKLVDDLEVHLSQMLS